MFLNAKSCGPVNVDFSSSNRGIWPPSYQGEMKGEEGAHMVNNYAHPLSYPFGRKGMCIFTS